jgi:hypothetical protein
LLGDAERQRLSGQVSHCEELRELQQRYLDEALRHSKTIAEEAPTDPARAPTAARFAAARTQHRAFARNAAQQHAAGQARARLAADDPRRRESGPVLTDGDRARSARRAGARATISSAVERRALLPAWFTTAVGHEPPSRGTDSWLDAAGAPRLPAQLRHHRRGQRPRPAGPGGRRPGPGPVARRPDPGTGAGPAADMTAGPFCPGMPQPVLPVSAG